MATNDKILNQEELKKISKTIDIANAFHHTNLKLVKLGDDKTVMPVDMTQGEDEMEVNEPIEILKDFMDHEINHKEDIPYELTSDCLELLELGKSRPEFYYGLQDSLYSLIPNQSYLKKIIYCISVRYNIYFNNFDTLLNEIGKPCSKDNCIGLIIPVINESRELLSHKKVKFPVIFHPDLYRGIFLWESEESRKRKDDLRSDWTKYFRHIYVILNSKQNDICLMCSKYNAAISTKKNESMINLIGINDFKYDDLILENFSIYDKNNKIFDIDQEIILLDAIKIISYKNNDYGILYESENSENSERIII